jgi:hypothetical protein
LFAPRFWESLVENVDNGRIESIDRIKQELERGSDELAVWAKKEFSHGFASTNDPVVLQSYAMIMDWAQANTQFSIAA